MPIRKKPAGSAVGAVESTRDRVRPSARAAVGVTGTADVPPIAEVFARAGAGRYPIVALGLLAAAGQFLFYVLFVMRPEISRSIGSSETALSGVGSFRTVNLALAMLFIAGVVHGRLHHRRAFIVATAFAWSAMFGIAGLMTTWWGLLLVYGEEGRQAGSIGALHPSLLMDSYPPEGRFRSLSFYYAFSYAGYVIASLSVVLIVEVLGFTWRATLIVFAALSLGASLFALRLRDPGYGRFDTRRVQEVVAADVGRPLVETGPPGIGLGFFETLRRLLLMPTLRRVFTAQAVLGMMVVPLYAFLFSFFAEEWEEGPAARGVIFAVLQAFAVVALLAFARRGEMLFRRDPARLIGRAALFLAAGSVAFSTAVFTPWLVPTVLLFGVALGFIALLTPSLTLIVLSIVPPQMRPHAAALSSVFLAAVGGLGGLMLLGGMDRRFGPPGAIIAFAVPGVIAALVLRGARRTVAADLDRAVDDVVEETQLAFLSAAGAHVPMLSCRTIDFSYGQLQVLFDVDFSVDEGEMVALLGTNGAGKSTLLRVVSGLGFPSRGSVRFRGSDVTYVDAERRLRLGIAQIPGGRAVFGPLTVIENLRLIGYSHGRNRRAVDRGIEECFAHAPVLGERRNQAAATLSGGEQQLLALGRAFILKPQLLLIDELSLGLAPRIVSTLLELVRGINAEGTAVVLVEQSVNIALSLVNHAYFMEKGEIRFDGPAQELLARGDLLRSVFLEGATKGLSR